MNYVFDDECSPSMTDLNTVVIVPRIEIEKDLENGLVEFQVKEPIKMTKNYLTHFIEIRSHFYSQVGCMGKVPSQAVKCLRFNIGSRCFLARKALSLKASLPSRTGMADSYRLVCILNSP